MVIKVFAVIGVLFTVLSVLSVIGLAVIIWHDSRSDGGGKE